MQDISGFGTELRLKASNTFPNGITITQFADDTDPVDIPSLQIGDKAVGLNGDLIGWRKGVPIVVTIAVIPDSDDHRNLMILADANRAGKGKRPVNDELTLTVIEPSGRQRTFRQGFITDGMLANSVASAGRFKSGVYSMTFEDVDNL